MTLATLKNLIAAYLSLRTVTGGTVMTPADFIQNGVDTLLLEINSAHFQVQKEHDFEYANATASLSVASTGSSLALATISGALANIKRVKDVLLPIGGSEAIPIEFMTNQNAKDRRRRQIGRLPYVAADTIDDYGVVEGTPYATQEGQVIRLFPAAQFTFPVTGVTLDVVQFLPDYTAPMALTISGSGTSAINTTWEQFGVYLNRPFYLNYQSGASAPATVYALWYSGTAWVLTTGSTFGAPAAASRYSSTSTAQLPTGLTYTATTFTGTLSVVATTGNVSTDFILDYGWEYLQWQAVLGLNKRWKEFAERQEGNLDEGSIETMAQRALQSFIAWDKGISTGTTTPPPLPEP